MCWFCCFFSGDGLVDDSSLFTLPGPDPPLPPFGFPLLERRFFSQGGDLMKDISARNTLLKKVVLKMEKELVNGSIEILYTKDGVGLGRE